jgi:hypothetical protein
MASMKVFLSVCLVLLVFCVGLVWWLRPDAPAVVDGRADATRNQEVSPAVPANHAIGGSLPSPPSWIPTDAERPDDQGALATWVPTDAEREDDRGASLTWIATDAERADDQGAFMTWTATDAERDDSVGVTVRGFAFRPRG